MKEQVQTRRILLAIAILQSLLAIGFWLLWGVTFLSLGPGIDFDKPTHQVSVGARIEETTLILGLPILWSTAAAILIWRRTTLGWWFSMFGDLVLASFGLILVIPDVGQFSVIRKYPALYSDVLYHLAVLLIPIFILILLFSRRVRARFQLTTLTRK